MRHVTLLLCLLLASAWAGRRLPSALDVASYSPEQVHLMLSDLYTSGDMIELQSAAESVILKNPKGREPEERALLHSVAANDG